VLERFFGVGRETSMNLGVCGSASGGFRLAYFRLGLLDGLQKISRLRSRYHKQMPDQDALHDKKERPTKKGFRCQVTHLWLSAERGPSIDPLGGSVRANGFTRVFGHSLRPGPQPTLGCNQLSPAVVQGPMRQHPPKTQKTGSVRPTAYRLKNDWKAVA